MARSLAYKDGVRVTHRTPALDHLENTALATQDELGYPFTLVVTSITDGVHNPDGQHPKSAALDIRTRTAGRRKGGMGATARKHAFRRRWQSKAGSRFTILLEGLGTLNEHLHGQVKKGEDYP